MALKNDFYTIHNKNPINRFKCTDNSFKIKNFTIRMSDDSDKPAKATKKSKKASTKAKTVEEEDTPFEMDLFQLAIWAIFAIEILFALSAVLATRDLVKANNDLAKADPTSATEIKGVFVFSSFLGFVGIVVLSFILARRLINENASPISRVFNFVYFVIIFALLYTAAMDPNGSIVSLLSGTGTGA